MEPTLLALVPSVGRFGPFVALSTGVTDIPPEDAGLPNVDLFSPELAAVLLLAWIGAAFAAGYALLRHRDVH